MLRSRIHIFLGSFIFSFFVLHSIFLWLGHKQTRLIEQEIKILHSEVENRFRLMIENKQSILMVSVTLAVYGKDFDRNYEQLADLVLQNFDDVLGLNLVDNNGLIIKVAPLEKNSIALGKISQNLPRLLRARERGEDLYVSPPFDLYQGVRGIGFYKPLLRDNNFDGWLALVQSLDRFMEKFVLSSFLGTYDLVIRDVETGLDYYTSAPVPKGEQGVTRNRAIIKGRQIDFISWRKEGLVRTYVSWETILLLALILSLTVSGALWAFDQRSRAKRELRNIEALLRATFTSTSNNLHSIQEQVELIKMGSGFVPLSKISSHLTYLTALINQLNVLVKISESKDPEKLERASILPMLVDLSKTLSEKLASKNQRLVFSSQDFLGVEIDTSCWIYFNDILSNVICFFINAATGSGEIQVELVSGGEHPTIAVLNLSQDLRLKDQLPPLLHRARRALESNGGQLTVESSMVLITLPTLLTVVPPDSSMKV